MRDSIIIIIITQIMLIRITVMATRVKVSLIKRYLLTEVDL